MPQRELVRENLALLNLPAVAALDNGGAGICFNKLMAAVATECTERPLDADMKPVKHVIKMELVLEPVAEIDHGEVQLRGVNVTPSFALKSPAYRGGTVNALVCDGTVAVPLDEVGGDPRQAELPLGFDPDAPPTGGDPAAIADATNVQPVADEYDDDAEALEDEDIGRPTHD